MKICPKCKKKHTSSDNWCRSDGTPLLELSEPLQDARGLSDKDESSDRSLPDDEQPTSLFLAEAPPSDEKITDVVSFEEIVAAVPPGARDELREKADSTLDASAADLSDLTVESQELREPNDAAAPLPASDLREEIPGPTAVRDEAAEEPDATSAVAVLHLINRPRWWIWGAGAAGVVLLSVVVFLLWHSREEPPAEPVKPVGPQESRPSPAARSVTKTTELGPDAGEKKPPPGTTSQASTPTTQEARKQPGLRGIQAHAKPPTRTPTPKQRATSSARRGRQKGRTPRRRGSRATTPAATSKRGHMKSLSRKTFDPFAE